MAKYENFVARADQRIARSLAATESPFTIEVRFLGGLTPRQQDAFAHAATRWTRLIVGDLPSVLVDGEVIDDLLIEAQGAEIDGPSNILGQAGPRVVRPSTATVGAWLPVKGIMTFDTADLEMMEQRGTLDDVITHEMGHVLGIGSVWHALDLLRDPGTTNPTFSGKAAIKEYQALRGPLMTPNRVPVENEGGTGSRDAHWRETVFRNELMSSRIGAPGNPISRMTAASLQDMGYVIDMSAAEPYQLPDLFALAEGGLLADRGTAANDGVVLPVIPRRARAEDMR